MKKFNWEEFKNTDNKIAVRCETEEQAEDFLKQMHEHGMKWNRGNSYLEYTHWEFYKIETAYNNTGKYCFSEWYRKLNYTILEWEDYMEKEFIKVHFTGLKFTKADLKTGMVVVTRNGTEYQVLLDTEIGEMLINQNGRNRLNDYCDNLLIEQKYGSNKFDIMKVKQADADYKLYFKHWDKMLTIWERTEDKLWSNGLTLEENHRKMWNALADNPPMSKEEYLKKNNITTPKCECFACESAKGDCGKCPICTTVKDEDCLNGKYRKWLDATGFERAKVANEIANLEWRER